MQPELQKSKGKRLLIAAAIFVLPVIAIIYALTLLLHPHQKDAAKVPAGSAFNTAFPAPNLPTKEKNKLELYMQAQEDSTQKQQERQKDLLSNAGGQPSAAGQNAAAPDGFGSFNSHPGVVTSPFQDDNSKKVTDRLAKIYAALGNSENTEASRKMPESPQPSMTADGEAQIARLQKLMQSYQNADTTSSPQLNQVKQVLDEIKEIQNPPKTSKNPYLPSHDDAPLPVTAKAPAVVDSQAIPIPTALPNAFLGLDDEQDTSAVVSDAIEAVIQTDQIVQTGSIVKLRLLQPIYIGSQKIPANTFIYGPASITGERVSIALTNAIYNDQIYPIALKVYDGSDGLDGLYVPGMITRDVVKQNMSQGVGGMELATLDPSLGAQAAAAAIETTKSILAKKISIVKATLKAGHLAILKPTGNQH